MGMFLEESRREFPARVIEVTLEADAVAPEVREQPWSSADPVLERLGDLGGSALSLALVLEDLRSGVAPPALVIAVGCAVRAGLPTAARTTVAGLSRLGPGYVEGQVGGGLAQRLVRRADALVLRGAGPSGAGRVLVLGTEGGVRCEALPELSALDLPERAALLRARFPEARGLVVGPAGEAGVAFANLATAASPPSFTGRGGLGARLGATGLSAVLVEGEVEAPPASVEDFAEALANSPHLRARGAGGTFELLDAYAARGELPADPAARGDYAERLEQRQSCPGCPTACRHVLKVGEGRLAGRFSATFPLGRELGIDDPAHSLRLLEACNAVGVDAAEMGAALALGVEARAGAPRHGTAEELAQAIQTVAEGPLAAGAEALAASLDGRRARTVRGSAARSTGDLSSLLGQCVSARGSDPMRSFPFLAENGGDEARLARLLAPLLTLPPGTFDPQDGAGKGRLVWWHENLASVLDATGFCAFSAAGLLGDGLADLDCLAGWLAPPGLALTGEALQAAGASLALLQREAAELCGAPGEADAPDWAREALDQRGVLGEYRTLRGLDGEGRVAPEARGKIGSLDLLSWALGRLGSEPDRPAPAPPSERRAPGRVELRAAGSLGEALGSSLQAGACLELELPVPLGSLLVDLVQTRPELAPWIRPDGDGAFSIYRERRRLGRGDWVCDGDVLDLVVAIGGG